MVLRLLATVAALGGLPLGALAVGSGALCAGNTTADEVMAQVTLHGKIAVVTGGDNGLGYATAMALAKRGAAVVIGNRNATHGQEAAANISQATGSQVDVLHLDLSSLDSVRLFAKQYVERFGPRLDILVNNAGITSPSKLSEGGFELVFQIDYLGHFLLTELLLPALRSAAPSRVVNLGSGAHENACEKAGWPQDCFKDWTYLPPPVVPKKNVTVHYKTRTSVETSSSYGIAKFANIMHAAALAEREYLAGVSAYSLTPGFALTSMTKGFDPEDPWVKLICQAQEHPDPTLPVNPCPFSANQGAAVIALLAAGQHDLQNGAYYSRTFACQPRPVAQQGFTQTMVNELYERSLNWTSYGGAADQLIV